MKKLLLLALACLGYGQVNADTADMLAQLTPLHESISQSVDRQLRKSSVLSHDIRVDSQVYLIKHGLYTPEKLNEFINSEYAMMGDAVADAWITLHLSMSALELAKFYQEHGKWGMVPFRGYQPGQFLNQVAAQRTALGELIAQAIVDQYEKMGVPLPWTANQVMRLGQHAAHGVIRNLVGKAMLRGAWYPVQATRKWLPF